LLQSAGASWMTLRTGACCLYNSSSPLPSPVPVCVTTSSGGPHPSPWRYALLALSREKPGVRIITLQVWRSSLPPQQCWVRCFGTLIPFQNTFCRRHLRVWKDPSSEHLQHYQTPRVKLCLPTLPAGSYFQYLRSFAIMMPHVLCLSSKRLSTKTKFSPLSVTCSAVLPPGIEPKWANTESKLPECSNHRERMLQNHDAESNPAQQIRNKWIIKLPGLTVAIYFIVCQFQHSLSKARGWY
jgi:hypothetical protein